MLERSTVQAVLSAALGTGGDFAELYAQDSDKQNMNMLDGKIAKQFVYENDGEKLTYSHFFNYLADICRELDVNDRTNDFYEFTLIIQDGSSSLCVH